MVYHLAYTHLAMEPIIISFFRQFEAKHPLYPIIKPFFSNTLAINDLGRNSLLLKDHKFDSITAIGLSGALQLMLKQWAHWDFTENSFPNDMKNRGFYQVTNETEDNLPGFHFRDDGFKIWNAIDSYVHNIIDILYQTDDDVKDDTHIQNLVREIKDPKRGRMSSLPELDSKQSLQFFLTTVMWTCSAQHSAINFGQFEYYAFIPNRPLALSLPMPDDEFLDQLDESYILKSLPSKPTAIETISLANVLSLLPVEETFVPQTENFFSWLPDFGHPRALEALLDFQTELKEIQKELEERNRWLLNQGQIPYNLLEPKRIAISISV